jgi:hypothetical protein
LSEPEKGENPGEDFPSFYQAKGSPFLPLGAEIESFSLSCVYFFSFFGLVVLGFEIRASCLLYH